MKSFREEFIAAYLEYAATDAAKEALSTEGHASNMSGFLALRLGIDPDEPFKPKVSVPFDPDKKFKKDIIKEPISLEKFDLDDSTRELLNRLTTPLPVWENRKLQKEQDNLYPKGKDPIVVESATHRALSIPEHMGLSECACGEKIEGPGHDMLMDIHVITANTRAG